MHTLISTFRHSSHLDMAIGEILHLGIEKKDIFAIPLDKQRNELRVFDTLHNSDGKSLLDLAAFIGVIGMLLGTIYGFMLPPGPVLTALIGLVAGGLIGFAIDYSVAKRKMNRSRHFPKGEVILIVVCPDPMTDKVEQALWDQNALAMSVLNR